MWVLINFVLLYRMLLHAVLQMLYMNELIRSLLSLCIGSLIIPTHHRRKLKAKVTQVVCGRAGILAQSLDPQTLLTSRDMMECTLWKPGLSSLNTRHLWKWW